MLVTLFVGNSAMLLQAGMTAFERGTDQIAPLLTREAAQKLVAFQGEPVLQARIEELAGKSTEGLLTDVERAEYEGYARAHKFLAVLQAKARKRLARG